MISKFHGGALTISQFRAQFPPSARGATLRDIIDVARSVHLKARALRVTLEGLPAVTMPAILHWDLTHFVVLVKVRGKKLRIHDPGIGIREFSFSEASTHFTGVVLELSPELNFRQQVKIPEVSIRQLVGHVNGARRGIAQLLLLGISLELCVLLSPLYAQWVLDDAIVASNRSLLLTLALGFSGLVVFQSIVSFFRGWTLLVLGTSLNYQWSVNAFAHLLRLPVSYFQRRTLGSVVSRFDSIDAIQQVLTNNFAESLIDGALVLGTLGMMFVYSTTLTLVTVASSCVYITLRWVSYSKFRRAKTERILHAATQRSVLFETVRGIQTLRLFNREGERGVIWSNILADQTNATFTAQKVDLGAHSATVFIFGLETVLVVWLAASMVIDSHMTVGMLFAFLAFKLQFTTRISGLANRCVELLSVQVHVPFLADLLLASAEDVQPRKNIAIESIVASLEVRNLSFRYNPSDPETLHDISFSIKDGEFVAICGPSGSGKTTLAKVLLGLLIPTSGEALIGGHPVLDVGLARYRLMIGSVMQDDCLFAGSIAENISFFDPKWEKKFVETCATLAEIDKEIVAMPMGYDTLVGDMGSSLSGGQRQRILLARALYKRPKLLLLDEATSHLDTANERRINDALRNLTVTRIVIAHREETLRLADRVLVLEGGDLRPAEPGFTGRA